MLRAQSMEEVIIDAANLQHVYHLPATALQSHHDTSSSATIAYMGEVVMPQAWCSREIATYPPLPQ